MQKQAKPSNQRKDMHFVSSINMHTWPAVDVWLQHCLAAAAACKHTLAGYYALHSSTRHAVQLLHTIKFSTCNRTGVITPAKLSQLECS
jgi:hypothetical protein